MDEIDLVIGVHSVIEALKNNERSHERLVATEDGLHNLKKMYGKKIECRIELVSTHKLQEEGKRYFKELDLDYQRIPSGVFLVSSRLGIKDLTYLYDLMASKNGLKLICLDQVTDVHNAGAIIRTACFYGVDAIIIPNKTTFGLTPSFFRNASGAAEYVPLIGAAKLTKVLTTLQKEGVLCLGLSEHAEEEIAPEIAGKFPKGTCIVLGREDVGISHAIMRILPNNISLKSMGEIKSLNVSIAGAIAMEKCFKNN